MFPAMPCQIQEEQKSPTLLELLQGTALFLWKEWPNNMFAVPLDEKGDFSLRGTCPHCRRESVLMRVTNNYAGWVRPTPKGTERILIAVMRCQGCLEFILGAVNHIENTYTYLYKHHYPLGTPDDSVAPEIPEHIQPDFQEALRCLSVNAYNATGEMCRRALEASCLDLGAPKKDVLEDMIDWLEEKRIITPGLKEVAHKVRLGGNRCAHPTPLAESSAAQITDAELADIAAKTGIASPVDKIGKDHAEAIVDFTRHFFQYVYVTPRQLQKYDFSKPKVPKS